MRKQTLLSTASRRFYAPSVRLGRHGHPMRDEQGHDAGGGAGAGGGDSGQGAGNAGGNGGNSGGADGTQGNQGNNTGTQFDPGSFWNSPAEETPPSGQSGGSAGTTPQGTPPQNQGDAFAQALGGLNFGAGVFTPEAVEAMNDGKPETFNTNMTNFGREVTRQSVIMAAQLMQKNNQQIEQMIEQRLESRFGQRDTESDLGKEIPSYSKPGMKPVVDGIMAQALRVSKGDRKAAIAMTKEMLKFQAGALGADFGITTPPGGAGNDFGTGQTTDWAQELLGRD